MSNQSVIESIFLQAVEIASTEEREAFLHAHCVDDKVRSEVERLIAAHAEVETSFRDPHGDVLATSDDVHEVERPGARIGPYKLMEQIGEGGFGVVYVAEQQKPVRRQVALKIVKPGMDTKEVIARFEAEQQALALMDHPNVARVLDAGTTEHGRPFFVMELVRGVKITDFCDKNRMTMHGRLELFIDVCHAVQHAHHKGIIHRDIKPNNILVTLHDGRPVPKVIDFGVAKALSQQLTERTIYTAYGQMIGTPEYMSPEQAEMSGLGIDTRSDIYSLGVLLYELLVGQPPFDAQRLRSGGFEAILRIIREEEPPKPSTRVSTMAEEATIVAEHRKTDVAKLRSSLSGELDWIVMKALDKDRNRRYETANGFAADVKRYLNDEQVRACPPSTAYRIRKFARRHRGAVAFAAALLALLCLGLAGTSIGLIRANAAAADLKQSEANAKAERNAAIEAREVASAAREAERLTNMKMAFDRGIALCEDGRIAAGLLWLSRSLELAPAQETAMQRVIRMNLSAWRRDLHTLEAIYPQQQAIGAVACNPDETLVFTGTTDGVAQVWDLRTKDKVGRPLIHQAQVHEIPSSKDGKFFLTASYDNTAVLWTMDSLDKIHTFEHADTVYGALFTPERKILTSTAGGRVLEWETADQEWSSASKWEATQLMRVESAVHDIALNHNGTQIVAACHDGDAIVFDLKERRPVAKFEGHTGRVATASFLAPNRVASGDTDGAVYLWAWEDSDGVARGRPFGKTYRHGGGVHRLRVNADGTEILTASFDNTAQLLSAKTGAAIGVAFEHESALYSIAFVGDDRILTGAGDGIVRMIRAARGSLVESVSQAPSTQPHIYSRDVRYVLIKNANGEATVHDALTGEALGSPISPQGGFYSLTVSDDKRIVATGGAQGIVQFWEIQSGNPIGTAVDHGAALSGVLFGTHGEWAYSAALNGVVQRWTMQSGEPHGAPLVDLGANAIRGIALSEDGAKLAVTTSNRTTLIVDATNGSVLNTLEGHRDMVMAAAFSPFGDHVVTGSFDNTANIYSVPTGELVAGPMPHLGPIWHCVAFGRLGAVVATACDDHTVRLWDVATGKPIGPRLSHEATLRAIAFRNEDTQLLTGTAVGTTRVWDVSCSPIKGSVEHVRLWLEASTGLTFNSQSSAVEVLDSSQWRAKRSELDGLGGSPQS